MTETGRPARPASCEGAFSRPPTRPAIFETQRALSSSSWSSPQYSPASYDVCILIVYELLPSRSRSRVSPLHSRSGRGTVECAGHVSCICLSLFPGSIRGTGLGFLYLPCAVFAYWFRLRCWGLDKCRAWRRSESRGRRVPTSGRGGIGCVCGGLRDTWLRF